MPALLDAPPVEDVAEGAGEETVAERRTSGRTLVLFGTLLAIAVMLAIPIRTLLAQRAELDALSTDNAAAQQRVAALTLQQQMWRNPRYIEAQARLRLNMARPGESALIALDHAARADQEKPEAPAVTWYQKLWRSTDTAAGRRAAPANDAD